MLFEVTHRVTSLEEGKETGYSTTSLLKGTHLFFTGFTQLLSYIEVLHWTIGQCLLSKALLIETCSNFQAFVPHRFHLIAWIYINFEVLKVVFPCGIRNFIKACGSSRLRSPCFSHLHKQQMVVKDNLLRRLYSWYPLV